MKCRLAQNYLYAASNGRRLPDAAVEHVAGCPRCQRIRQQLDRIDLAVPHLAVPNSSSAKAALIERILTMPVPATAASRVLPYVKWQRVAVGLAASVLALVVGLLMFGNNKGPAKTIDPPDPLLAMVVESNTKLANARGAKERAEELANLADGLQNETRNVARVASAEDLAALAALYRDVVKKGLMTQADEMTTEERQQTLPGLADRLWKAADDADRLAADVPPAAQGPLKQIAAEARAANQALRKKAGEV